MVHEAFEKACVTGLISKKWQKFHHNTKSSPSKHKRKLILLELGFLSHYKATLPLPSSQKQQFLSIHIAPKNDLVDNVEVKGLQGIYDLHSEGLIFIYS